MLNQNWFTNLVFNVKSEFHFEKSGQNNVLHVRKTRSFSSQLCLLCCLPGCNASDSPAGGSRVNTAAMFALRVCSLTIEERFQKLHQEPDAESRWCVCVDYGVSRGTLTTRSSSFPNHPKTRKVKAPCARDRVLVKCCRHFHSRLCRNPHRFYATE